MTLQNESSFKQGFYETYFRDTKSTKLNRVAA